MNLRCRGGLGISVISVILVGPVLVLGGCASEQTTPGGAPVESASGAVTGDASSQRQPDQPSFPINDSLKTEEVSRVSLKAGVIAPGAVRDDQLVVSSGPGMPSSDVLQLVGLRSLRVRTIGHSSWPRGLIQGVQFVGDWVVYNDQDRIQGMDMKTKWQVVAVNVRTGARRVLATSGDQTQPVSPWPHSDGHSVVWEQIVEMGNPAAGTQLWQWKPGWQRPRVVVRDARGISHSALRVLAHRLMYVARSPGHNWRGPNADVFVRDLASGRVRQLTHHGLVQWMDATPDHVAWAGLSRKKAELSDPTSVWVTDLESGKSRRLSHGWNGGNVVTGDNFVAWYGGDSNIVISSLDGERRTRIPRHHDYVPFRMLASGHRLVYATRADKKGSPIVVHVLRIGEPADTKE